MNMTQIKRKMDWKGLEVQSIKPLRNNYASLPSGTRFIVSCWSAGLSMRSEKCSCCGISLQITKVEPLYSVELLDSDYNRRRLAWNQKCSYEKGMYGRVLITPDEPMPEKEGLS